MHYSQWLTWHGIVRQLFKSFSLDCFGGSYIFCLTHICTYLWPHNWTRTPSRAPAAMVGQVAFLFAACVAGLQQCRSSSPPSFAAAASSPPKAHETTEPFFTHFKFPIWIMQLPMAHVPVTKVVCFQTRPAPSLYCRINQGISNYSKQGERKGLHECSLVA